MEHRGSFRAALAAIVLALFGLLPAAASGPVDAQPATSEPVAGVDYVDGRVLVSFKPGTAAAAQAQVHRAAGGGVAGVVAGLGVQIVNVGPGRTLAAIDVYAKNPNVMYAEVDGIVHASLGCTEASGSFSNDDCSWRQWGLNNAGHDFGAGSGTEDADVDIPEAWTTGNTGGGIIIAVLDTGFDRSHEDLDVGAGDFADFTSTGIDDKHGHGTWTGSIAAGLTNNNMGVAGTATSSRLIVGKVLDNNGSGSWSQVANGINWAVAQADGAPLVISMSLGGSCRGGPFGCGTLENAVNNAHNAGALLIAAAGNSGGSTEYPGAFANVLAVAATDANDAIASFSSTGNVAAPGVNIIGAFPDCSGAESTFTLRTNNGLDCEYDYGSGTSASTPIVAGIAAIVWSSNSAMTNTEVRSHIEASAEDVPGTSRDGLGRVSACTALSAAGVTCTEGDGGGGDDPTPTPTEEPTPTPTPEPGRLVGSAENDGKTWTAIVTSNAEVSVSGTWSYDGSDCTIPAGGECRLPDIPKKVGSVTFTTTGGESIDISKP